MSVEFEQTEQIVNDLRRAGIVTLRRVPLLPAAEDDQRFQKIAEICGFRRPILQQIDRASALSILVSLLHRDMAYDVICIPLDQSKEIAENFIPRFDSDFRYFINGYFVPFEES